MLLSVPIGISRTGCGTVTRPGFVGCLSCTWLPLQATSHHPSRFNSLNISRLLIRQLHTKYTQVKERLAETSACRAISQSRVDPRNRATSWNLFRNALLFRDATAGMCERLRRLNPAGVAHSSGCCRTFQRDVRSCRRLEKRSCCSMAARASLSIFGRMLTVTFGEFPNSCL
jgi:hypothetical protein